MYREKIDKFIDAHKTEMLEDIAELCKIDSTKDSYRAGRPYGDGCFEALGAALHIAECYGFSINNYDNYVGTVDLNDKELEMFHIEKKEDVLGINIFDNPIFPKEMKERLKKNEDADFTFRYDFSKVGSYYQNSQKEAKIDLMTKVTTLYDNEHQPINYLLINADKTETTVAYNKIQEFEEFFELVGDYAKVGYAHFNVLT